MSAVMLAEAAALTAAACWAVAPIIYKRAMSNTTPFAANTVRSVSTAAVMLLILLVLGKGGVLVSLPIAAVVATVASGILGLIVGDIFYMIGLRTVGVSVAAPIVSTYPLFSMIWSTLFLGQAVTMVAVAGTLTIVLGVWLLSRGESKATALGKGKFALTGIMAVLVTSFVWSFSILLMDMAVDMPGVETLDANYALLTARIIAIALILLALTPWADRKRNFLKVKRWTAIELCIAGLVALGVGWLLMNYSLQVLGTEAIIISSSTPLFSTLAAFLLFKEKATWHKIAGSIIVVVGVILIL